MFAVPRLRILYEFTISTEAERQLGGCLSLSSKAQLMEIVRWGIASICPAPDYRFVGDSFDVNQFDLKVNSAIV